MKKAILFLLGLTSFLFSLSQSAENPGTVKGKEGHSLLWKISGNGLSRPSYLFGTMHVLCADDAKLSEGLKAVIKQCEELYFEIDISDLKGMMNSMKFMRMSDNKKLSDLIDSADYAKVKNYFNKHSPLLPFSML